jgi:hypothetical protein
VDDCLGSFGVEHRPAMPVTDGLCKPGSGEHVPSGLIVNGRARHQSVEVFGKPLRFQQNRLASL